MRKNGYLVSFVALIFFITTGCASIVSKSLYPVTISSTPGGAEISITNRAGKTIFSGNTPTTVTLEAKAGYFKGENYTVTFKKDGYANHTAQITRGVDTWYILGNIVFGGLIGWLIVDPATGAMWTLDDLHANLAAQSASLPKEGINILAIDDVPKHLRPYLVRIK